MYQPKLQLVRPLNLLISLLISIKLTFYILIIQADVIKIPQPNPVAPNTVNISNKDPRKNGVGFIGLKIIPINYLNMY